MTTPDLSPATDRAGTDPAPRPGERRRAAVAVAAFLAMAFILREDLLTVLDRPTGPRVAGLVGLGGVVVLFAGVVMRMPWRSPRPSPAAAGAVLGAQALCVVLACVGMREDGLAGAALVCVTAIFLLPRGAAGWVIAGYVAAVAGLPRVLPGWQPADEYVLTGVLGGLAAFSMVTGAERRRRLARAQEDAEQLATFRERERIVRDMHDVLGHALTVISVKAELAARLYAASDGAAPASPSASASPTGADGAASGATADAPDPAAPAAGDASDAAASGPTALLAPARSDARAVRAVAELADVQSLARTALADVRGLIADERRPSLTGELAAARAALDAAGIAADLPDAVDAVPADRRELFAWALREGCTNVLRHSDARHVRVDVTADSLVIEDDGAAEAPSDPDSGGAPPDPRSGGGPPDQGSGEPAGTARPGSTSSSGARPPSSAGHGLTGLGARARAAGAHLTTGPRPGGGFRLSVTYPTAKNHA